MLLWLIATVVAILGVVQLTHGDVLLGTASSVGASLIGPGRHSGLPSLRTA